MNTCLECSEKTSNAKFCSRRCSGLYSGKHSVRKKRSVVLRVCTNTLCNNSTVNSKFCSRSCSVAVNNSKSPKRKAIATIKEIICICGTATFNAKFCSTTCATSGARALRDAKLVEIAVATDQIPTNHKLLLRLLLSLHGRRCMMSDCGITEWKGLPIDLTIDHIDGKSYNHVLSNVRLICDNCDRQLPTYKARNKGNGRAKRRERYAANLTY